MIQTFKNKPPNWIGRPKCPVFLQIIIILTRALTTGAILISFWPQITHVMYEHIEWRSGVAVPMMQFDCVFYNLLFNLSGKTLMC